MLPGACLGAIGIGWLVDECLFRCCLPPAWDHHATTPGTLPSPNAPKMRRCRDHADDFPLSSGATKPRWFSAKSRVRDMHARNIHPRILPPAPIGKPSQLDAGRPEWGF